MLVPVIDSNNKPLMPCSNERASYLIRSGSAKRCWRKGIFCIKLTKEPSARQYQPIALGIDPGSKREGYTAATEKAVVLNITTNTPDWVKARMVVRRDLRRARRYRKTPYRKCRLNRAVKHFIAPSTRARWGAKLRIINQLRKVLPITVINVEDVKATTKNGKKRWNVSFSPLETGKNWFYTKIEGLDIELVKTTGKQTKARRDQRGFKKSSNKLDYKWEAHNVDSHCLAEIALNKELRPTHTVHKIEFLQLHRRQLFFLNQRKGGVIRRYGGTVTFGMSRGAVLRYVGNIKPSKYSHLLTGLVYLGGCSNNRLSIHDLKDHKRLSHRVRIEDVRVLYNSKQTICIIN
jgi:hypothetical protein